MPLSIRPAGPESGWVQQPGLLSRIGFGVCVVLREGWVEINHGINEFCGTYRSPMFLI